MLCGGNGSRLWPLSRTLYPKQFNQIIGDQSLFQLTIQRNASICDKKYIVSSDEQYFLALNQLDEIGETANSFILEPLGRNTAPAIALACFEADPEEIVLVTPSDHIIKDTESYYDCVKAAERIAEEGNIATFGIKPLYPETGYGYMETDGAKVISFKEKPDFDTARRYLQSGTFFWNSGMFMFKASVFLQELQLYATEIYETTLNAFRQVIRYRETMKVQFADMLAIPSNSIDYAVMEKSQKVNVVISDFGWSDLGGFDALYEELPKDEYDTTINEQLISINSHRNLVLSHTRTVATIDIDDLIIVDTSDALLISRRGSSQKVKLVVEQLKQIGSALCDYHETVFRPWGHYTVMGTFLNYKIKKVVIHPGKQINAQRHYHRNEHWIVVSGTALINIAGESKLLCPNESTFIKIGQEHVIHNMGKIDLHLIEVQTGEYIGEDDTISSGGQ
ncbi:Mannose-1-phosphate guanylyltransferase RfbM [compost metagenome]